MVQVEGAPNSWAGEGTLKSGGSRVGFPNKGECEA